MNRHNVWIILLLSTLLLVACDEAKEEPVVGEVKEVEEIEKEPKEGIEEVDKKHEEEMEGKAGLLSETEMKEIVINNLDRSDGR